MHEANLKKPEPTHSFMLLKFSDVFYPHAARAI